MVYNNGAESQGQDRQGRYPAGLGSTHADVQLFRVQGCVVTSATDVGILTHGPCLADTKVVYRRYASLFFVCGISPADNELITLEIIHRYVEVLDRYFGNVRRSFVPVSIWRLSAQPR